MAIDWPTGYFPNMMLLMVSVDLDSIVLCRLWCANLMIVIYDFYRVCDCGSTNDALSVCLFSHFCPPFLTYCLASFPSPRLVSIPKKKMLQRSVLCQRQQGLFEQCQRNRSLPFSLSQVDQERLVHLLKFVLLGHNPATVPQANEMRNFPLLKSHRIIVSLSILNSNEMVSFLNSDSLPHSHAGCRWEPMGSSAGEPSWDSG